MTRAAAPGARAAAAAVAGPAPAPRRLALRVQGTVQGVGFRPFVHRLAAELSLSGFVCNEGSAVLVEVEGPAATIGQFKARLGTEAPPLARVQRVSAEHLPANGGSGFEIRSSRAGTGPHGPVPADSTTCPQCLAELLDPADRRYRYPFINCTSCGPRFTIVHAIPYDRPNTTMAGFVMCDRCRAEYEDPADRRFHAQPNACPDCGPRIRLTGCAGRGVGGSAGDAVEAAARALDAGAIVAVKGLGGFHLACRADDDQAVARLRAGKRREAKPLAVMVADMAGAERLVELQAGEAELLRSLARPIVLAARRGDAPVAAAVAPGSPELGVMLPYTPLHHLLLADAGGPLVMTSGNRSEEPIVHRDQDALERLAGIADRFLLHDRPIAARTEDSVIRLAGVGERRVPITIRRSRGYVPESLALPAGARRPLIACGAELKSTFCLARGERAWVSPHIGDLTGWEVLGSFREAVGHLCRLLGLEPELIAHDLHPDYLSSAWAAEQEQLPTLGVQHHHAHLAACLAEHGLEGPAVGAIFDGAGMGSDGTVWGGELLFGGLSGFERDGHLRRVALPGGDRAAKQPWRMACAWMLAAGLDGPVPPRLRGRVDLEAWRGVAGLARSGQCALTTSAGRLFDAVAALCGLRTQINYEGQAAIELQAHADPLEARCYPLPVLEDADRRLVLDAAQTIRWVARDAAAGTSTGLIAARFHNALAAATAQACRALAERRGVDLVVLSGGVFQNALLLERTAARLSAARLRVLVARALPPGDGGISYGQAAVAAAAPARQRGARAAVLRPRRR